MTATERRYFVAYDRFGFCGIALALNYGALTEFHTLANACYLASTDHTTGGRVYERTESGFARLVAQMARRK